MSSGKEVKKTSATQKIFSGSLENLPESVDLIVFNYVVEHVQNPSEFIHTLLGKLSPTGMLVALVPDLARNPFDLVIADHLSHYTELAMTRQFEKLPLLYCEPAL